MSRTHEAQKMALKSLKVIWTTENGEKIEYSPPSFETLGVYMFALSKCNKAFKIENEQGVMLQ